MCQTKSMPINSIRKTMNVNVLLFVFKKKKRKTIRNLISNLLFSWFFARSAKCFENLFGFQNRWCCTQFLFVFLSWPFLIWKKKTTKLTRQMANEMHMCAKCNLRYAHMKIRRRKTNTQRITRQQSNTHRLMRIMQEHRVCPVNRNGQKHTNHYYYYM